METQKANETVGINGINYQLESAKIATPAQGTAYISFELPDDAKIEEIRIIEANGIKFYRSSHN